MKINYDEILNKIPKENKYMVSAYDLLNYINTLETRINKACHLITHSDITDYRVFDEELLKILRGEENE